MIEIPIRNVYYLLCYAWRHVGASDLVPAKELGEFRHVHDLFGSVLACGVTRLLHQHGLDRQYLEREEEVAGVRGKLLLGETVKRALLPLRRTACRTTALSRDVLHNQILKSTLRDLLRIPALLDEVGSQVRATHEKLGGVAEIRLTRQAFGRLQLDGNRGLYRFLLAIARLVYESRLIGEEAGENRFFDFRRDDQKMWGLFEAFVTEFFRREQSQYKVNHSGRQVYWARPEGTQADLARLPRMQADVILESPDRRIILDTKFYRRSPTSKAGTLPPSNLYQLLAYLRNRQADRPQGPRHEGILLYPALSGPLRVDLRLEGYRLQARGIDLAQPWEQIHRDLLGVVLG